MKFVKRFIIGILAVFLGTVAYAQQNEGCPVEPGEAKYLKTVRDAAREFIDLKRCRGATEAEIDIAYRVFLNVSRGWFNQFGGFEGDVLPISYMESLVSSSNNSSVSVDVLPNDTLSVHDKVFVPADVEKCASVAGGDCADVLYEFVDLYGPAQHEYSMPEVEQVITTIEELRKEWEPFLTTMRSQTALELTINGLWSKRNETDDWMRPPSMQWIVLHPIVLLEYVDAAKDGSEMNEALGLEIIGANWWKQDKWYIPTGGSLLALYSDRAEVDDWRYGVAVHFNSNYTIGYTNRGGDSGIFLSVDLLKAFEDKEKVFNSYLNR